MHTPTLHMPTLHVHTLHVHTLHTPHMHVHTWWRSESLLSPTSAVAVGAAPAAASPVRCRMWWSHCVTPRSIAPCGEGGRGRGRVREKAGEGGGGPETAGEGRRS